MQRIGDHLSYLAKYALGNTLYSADVQGVRALHMYNFIPNRLIVATVSRL